MREIFPFFLVVREIFPIFFWHCRTSPFNKITGNSIVFLFFFQPLRNSFYVMENAKASQVNFIKVSTQRVKNLIMKSTTDSVSDLSVESSQPHKKHDRCGKTKASLFQYRALSTRGNPRGKQKLFPPSFLHLRRQLSSPCRNITGLNISRERERKKWIASNLVLISVDIVLFSFFLSAEEPRREAEGQQ